MVPERHVDEQVGVAVSAEVVFPTPTVTEPGLTVTPVRAGGGVDVIVMVAEFCFVTPLREATTASVTVPAVLPAVNVVDCAVGELIVPIEGVTRVQA